VTVLDRACAWLAPEETASAPALPLTLLVRPVPLLSLALLGVNDHLLKGSGLLPGWVTGKLSDVAGMIYFPLLLVTGLNLAGWLLGKATTRPPRWASPNLRQVTIACVATAVFFSAVQVSPAVKDVYARATALLSVWSDAPYATVTMDPTDVLAAPAVLIAWWQARRSLRRLPPGRLVLWSDFSPQRLAGADWADAAGVADVARLLDAEGRRALKTAAQAVADGRPEAADVALAALRR
jgi:hypothetical protein